MERRVVITGMGAVTPIGNNVIDSWQSIKDGKCGIDKITAFDTTDHKVHLADEIKDLKEEEFLDKKQIKRLDKFSRYAIIASKEAMKDSGITPENTNMERVVVK